MVYPYLDSYKFPIFVSLLSIVKYIVNTVLPKVRGNLLSNMFMKEKIPGVHTTMFVHLIIILKCPKKNLFHEIHNFGYLNP